MIISYTFFDELFNTYDAVHSIIEIIMTLLSIYGACMFIRNCTFKTIKLSIGKFKIRYKYYDVQNITNIVSANFYDGGQVPPNIRREIIELTCPKVKLLD